MDVKKDVKIKSPNFWQNYFFLESNGIELIENDDESHESSVYQKLNATKLHVILKYCPVCSNT